MTMVERTTYVNVEAPFPNNMLHEQAANERSKNTSKRPGGQYDGEVLGSLSQRDDISEDDLAHRDDSTTADTLDSPAKEKNAKVLGYGCA